MAAEPRRQSVVGVVTVDFFYRRAPAYSAELKPGNLVRGASALLQCTWPGGHWLFSFHFFHGSKSALTPADMHMLFAALLPLSSRVGRTP